MLKVGFIVFLITAILAITAYASYTMYSESVTVTVKVGETLGLASSAIDIIAGESITLTATISDYKNGVVISFYDSASSPSLIGQATTAGGGIATLTITPVAGTHIYTAIGLHP
jgi:hypothetical protein